MAWILFVWIIINNIYVHSASNEYKINVQNANQRFDGIGAVSGGGATSKLLFTYFPTEKDRRPILEVLFNKQNGLQMLKVEMGGDDQSTEGSESSHMSERDQLSVKNYEFQLIKEARKINPKIRICALPWAFPGWLGNQNPYENVTETANYVIEWLKIARNIYQFEVYCLGVWNERNFSEIYVNTLRNLLNTSGFHKVKIVAGEGFQMDKSYPRLLDKDFINTYDIIGVHYPGGKIPEYVRKSGKTIWASEDYSTDNRETGEGCMARTLNWNYVHGNITGMLTWHMISAFYPQIAWFRCGLSFLTEESFQTDLAFDVLRYTTGHVKRGWKILPHGNGSGNLTNGGTYVGYTNGRHLSIVIETMTYESSLCEYSSPEEYNVSKIQFVRFKLDGKFEKLAGLNISLNYEKPQFLKNLNGFIEFAIKSDSYGVITSLPIVVPRKIEVKVTKLPSNYFDDFSDYASGEEPRFWMPQKGAWEVRKGVAIQKTIQPPISWCTFEITTPYAVMSFRNSSKKISGDVSIPQNSSANSVILGLYSNCSGCDISQTNCEGLFVEFDYINQRAKVFLNFVKRLHVTDFKIPLMYGIFHKFSVEKLTSTKITVRIDNLKKNVAIKSLIGLNGTLFLIGTGNFGVSYWDNLMVE